MSIIEQLQSLPDAVKADLQKAINERNRNQFEVVLAQYQKEMRTQLKAQGVDMDSFVPVIGRDIRPTDVLRQVFRVLDFDRDNSTTRTDGIPKRRISVLPYGNLLVESPILNRPLRFPINHRLDFMLASSVFDGPALPNDMLELLVTFAPKRTLLGPITAKLCHSLHYVICPRGTLERYCDFADAVHMRRPEPEKLFGEFRYFYGPGEIKVEVKQNAALGSINGIGASEDTQF